MTRTFVFVIAALFAGVVSGKTHATSFLPRNKNAISIRGGAGPLDVTDTAKVATILNGINSGMVVLSPSTAGKVYGVNLTPTSTLMMSRVGAMYVMLRTVLL